MFQVMHNIFRVKQFTIFCFCFISSIGIASADDDVDLNCPLQNTPLLRCDSYSGYISDDKELNSVYRALSKSLDKSSFLILKNTQRKWINWRDGRCLAVQNKSNQSLGAYGSTVHDGCIMELTEQRTLELRKFIRNPTDAVNQKYGFSRVNETVDAN